MFKLSKFRSSAGFNRVVKISSRVESDRDIVKIYMIFTALERCTHCMQRGLATRKLSVYLSVCLSVQRVICDKTKESCASILIPHERSFTLVL